METCGRAARQIGIQLRCGEMDDGKLTTEIQKTAYGILKEFHEVCAANGIGYSLAYGTLLGAVRHKGFIPWDDDIDVFMLRSEYEKLRSVFVSESCELVDCDIDDEYPYLFPKIRKKGTTLIEKGISDLNYNIGVYIDIFVLDEVPSGAVAAWFKKLSLKIKYKKYRLCELNLDSINTVLRVAAKFVKKFYSCNKLAKKCAKVYKNTRGELLRDVTMPSAKYFIRKEYMEKQIPMQFGDDYFLGIEKYDELLTSFYGDYMKLPDEKDRVSNHSFYKIEL